MCTSMVAVLVVLTYKEVIGDVWSIRESDSQRSVCWWLTREPSWWILIYKEVSWWCVAHWGKFFISFMTHWGSCVSSTQGGVFLIYLSSLGKTLFLITLEGVVLMFWTHGGALNDSWGKIVYFMSRWGLGWWF